MISSRLAGKKGEEAYVTPDGAVLGTLIHPSQDTLSEVYGTSNRNSFFSDYLRLTTNTAVFQMNVNGATTNQVFELVAKQDRDIFIRHITVMIADGTSSLNKFGALAALTNGWDLRIFESGEFSNIIEISKTGGDVAINTGLTNVYGSGSSVYALPSYLGGDNAIAIPINLEQIVPGGIRIAKKSLNKLVSTVRDDLTALSECWVRCLGYTVK